MRRITQKLFLFGWVVLAFSGSSTLAATYYASTQGSDSSVGTESQPFRTIRKGISVLKAGDTLYIRAGSYGESINSGNQTMPTGTSWTDAPKIAAYPGESVMTTSVGLWHSYVKYMIFDGLIIDNQRTLDEAVYLAGGANHIRFKNCEIRNSRRQGVLIPHPDTHHNEFIGCNIHSNGTTVSYDHGLYIAGSYNLLENCRIHDNATYGVHIYNGYGERATGNVVRGNLVYNNSRLGTGGGIVASHGENNLVYNNVIWGHAQTAIDITWGNPSGTKILNNTVYANGAGIYISSQSSNITVANNIVYQSGTAITNLGSNTILSNNLITDPKFANLSASDFRLQSTSPAIDAGTTLSEVTVDLDGTVRPQGTRIDIGAYEFQSGTAQVTPPTNLQIIAP